MCGCVFVCYCEFQNSVEQGENIGRLGCEDDDDDDEDFLGLFFDQFDKLSFVFGFDMLMQQVVVCIFEKILEFVKVCMVSVQVFMGLMFGFLVVIGFQVWQMGVIVLVGKCCLLVFFLVVGLLMLNFLLDSGLSLWDGLL